MGMPGLPIATVPHPMADQSPQQVAEIARQVLPELLHILTSDSETLEKEYKEKKVHRKGKSRLRYKAMFGDEFSISDTDDILKVPDSLDAVNRIFYSRGWTDGLPIIPPTEKRIERMLNVWDQEPETVIGEIAPKCGF